MVGVQVGQVEASAAIMAVFNAVSAALELFTAKQVWRRRPELHESRSTVEHQFPCHDNATPASVLTQAWEGSRL
jgi:hypothetical protein